MPAPDVQEPRLRSWSSPLDQEQSGAAVSVAREVALRTTDPARLAAAIDAAARQTAFPRTARWEPHAIASGDAGLTLLCGYLEACLPDEGWDRRAHEHLGTAVRGAEAAPAAHPGLFGGLSGLALAAWALSRDGTRYQRLLGALDAALLPQAVDLAHEVRLARGGLAVSSFDVISGLGGVAAYLLCRRHHPSARRALEAVLTALVELTREQDGVLPRWHTPPELMADADLAREFPDGSLNCGLAHGIPGPLAALALALREGVAVPGQAAAVARAADWLAEHRIDDAWGPNWPGAVPATPSSPSRAATSADGWPTRAAWCYGAPGVARALWLAGDALGDAALHALAADALEAVLARPVPVRAIDSPTFCHGVAGLLQIVLRFARDSGRAALLNGARTLTAQLLDAYDPRRPLGYANLEPGDRWVDEPGVLDGAAGVALVLLAAATDAEPVWDRCFLLA